MSYGWTNSDGEPIMDGAAYRFEQALDAENPPYVPFEDEDPHDDEDDDEEFDVTADDTIDLAPGVSLDGPGTLPTQVPDGHIALSLRIENTYELHDDVVTYALAVVPLPPKDGNADDHEAWAYEHIQALTGVGHSSGDSWYDVEVIDSSAPDVIEVGTTWDWGY